jgi:sulfatase modifying factor 1
MKALGCKVLVFSSLVTAGWACSDSGSTVQAPASAPLEGPKDAGAADSASEAPSGETFCPNGFTSCGTTCVDVQSDAAHCGACGNRCGAPSGAEPACVGGLCDFSCPTGVTKTASGCVSKSCVSLPSSSATCGLQDTQSCCDSSLVVGGAFARGTDSSLPATVSSFRLDLFEVTVGRFRQFVQDAVAVGWLPLDGSGKHMHLHGGAGLATETGHEAGWMAQWNSQLPKTKADWDSKLSCESGYGTWTPDVGANERKPINCLSWYMAFAFCIYDGGFCQVLLNGNTPLEVEASSENILGETKCRTKTSPCTIATGQLRVAHA